MNKKKDGGPPMKFRRVSPAALVVALGLCVGPAFAGDPDGPPTEPQKMMDTVLSVPHVPPTVVVDKE